MNKIILIIFTFLLMFVLPKEIVFNSGKFKINLIELYTSQGCSSCPPADNILFHLKNDVDLWNKFIPIAFHVDYWNWLGFEDIYSTSKNSQRQKKYFWKKYLSGVYTPAFVVNNQEVSYSKNLFSIFKKQENNKVGNLQGKIKKKNLFVYFENLKKIKKTTLQVGILGFDLATSVDAGENINKTLFNNFVLLSHQVFPFNQKKKISLKKIKPTQQKWEKVEKIGIVIWISSDDQLKYYQATGAFVPKKRFERI